MGYNLYVVKKQALQKIIFYTISKIITPSSLGTMNNRTPTTFNQRANFSEKKIEVKTSRVLHQFDASLMCSTIKREWDEKSN